MRHYTSNFCYYLVEVVNRVIAVLFKNNRLKYMYYVVL